MAILQGSGGRASATGSTTPFKSTPSIQHVLLTTATTEYTITLPANTVAYQVYNLSQTSAALIQYAYSSGQSGTTYGIIGPGSSLSESYLNSGAISAIYIQSNRAATTVVVISWAG
jgi:hypothetical protein